MLLLLLLFFFMSTMMMTITMVWDDTDIRFLPNCCMFFFAYTESKHYPNQQNAMSNETSNFQAKWERRVARSVLNYVSRTNNNIEPFQFQIRNRIYIRIHAQKAYTCMGSHLRYLSISCVLTLWSISGLCKDLTHKK